MRLDDNLFDLDQADCNLRPMGMETWNERVKNLGRNVQLEIDLPLVTLLDKLRHKWSLFIAGRLHKYQRG
jgi:hypothetical protein